MRRIRILQRNYRIIALTLEKNLFKKIKKPLKTIAYFFGMAYAMLTSVVIKIIRR